MLIGHVIIPCKVSGVTTPPIVIPSTTEQTRASGVGTWILRPASAAAAANTMDPASHPAGNFAALSRKPPTAPISRDSAMRTSFCLAAGVWGIYRRSMPRPQPAVKHPSLDGRGRHHGTAAESDRRAGTGKKGATRCGASARELLREEIANLS